MPLKAVCIELRPNLCSGHVFLQFEHDLSDRSKTRVVIKEHDIHIVEDGADGANSSSSELVMRHASFGIDIQQISVFIASGQHISFRFNYTQIDLDAVQKAANFVGEPKSQPLLLSFGEGEDVVSLHCSNCLYELVPSCSYKRLREFPSGLIDPSEFFCHNHGTTSKQQPPTLVPSSSDLYYGLNHIVLNIAVLQNRVINSLGHLYCKRCMQMLGLTILEDAAAKLWADALRWLPTHCSPETHPLLPRQLFQHSTVTQLMLRLLSDLWTQSVPQLCPSTSRALLIATMPNRQQQYMLIHVLERQLALLRRLLKKETTSEAQQLHYFRACKLYFRVFDNRLDELEQQMDLPRLHISPYLFRELQARLNRNSQLIPRAWRYNSVEEKLLLTYFFYENEQQELEQLQEHKTTQLLVKVKATTPKKQMQQKKSEVELKLEHKQKQKQVQEEYETDAGLDASLDEDEEDETDSDDEHSDTDSETTSSLLLHKSASIREYEQNLVKRWLTQRQTSPDSHS